MLAAGLSTVYEQPLWQAYGSGIGLIMACGLLHVTAISVFGQKRLKRGLINVNAKTQTFEQKITTIENDVKRQGEDIKGEIARKAMELGDAQQAYLASMGDDIMELKSAINQLQARPNQQQAMSNRKPVSEYQPPSLTSSTETVYGSISEQTVSPQTSHEAVLPPSNDVRIKLPQMSSEEQAMADIIKAALVGNRVELDLQPIKATASETVKFYEAFSYIKDSEGERFSWNDYLIPALKGGYLGALDTLQIFRSIKILDKIAEHDPNVGIFCNLSMAALTDHRFFPQMLQLLRQNQELSPLLLFEFTHSDFANRSNEAAANMYQLSRLGFRFSVDHVTTLDLNLADMQRAGVRYVKMQHSALLSQLEEGINPQTSIERVLNAEDISLLFTRYGIDLIATHVEDEASARQLLRYDIPYGQGQFFGPQRLIKEALIRDKNLNETIVAQATA